MEKIKEALCSDVWGLLQHDPDFESLSKDKQKKVEDRCRMMVSSHLDILSHWLATGIHEEVMYEKNNRPKSGETKITVS